MSEIYIRKPPYLSQKADNEKNNGTLLCQTLKVGEKKVPSEFIFLSYWPRYLNAIWASYSVRNILISWEVESYPRKSFENLEKSQNLMNKTSFSFWDHVNSGLSKTCLKNLCKYEAIQTSQAAPRVHMFSIFKNQSTPLNFLKMVDLVFLGVLVLESIPHILSS